MVGAPAMRNKAAGTIGPARSLDGRMARKEAAMAEDREKISTGPNDRPRNESIAGTGPGIPDEALGPGEEPPQPPTAEQVKRMAEGLGAPEETVDTLPLDGE